MSAIDELLDHHDGDHHEWNSMTDFSCQARAELASLRAAVAERDAAIARAVVEERESCAKIVDNFGIDMLTSDTDEIDAVVERDNQIAAAIRARGERKE